VLRWQVESALLGSKQRPRKQPPTVLPVERKHDEPALLARPSLIGAFLNDEGITHGD